VISLEPRTLHQPEKLQNVSKNDYGFTTPIFIVNRIHRALTCRLSIECTPFTGGCRKMVQRVEPVCEIPNVYADFPRFFPKTEQRISCDAG
jgi:hypothetical protein